MSAADVGSKGPWFSFEGRPIPFRDGDTIASALFRAGIRTFSRSFKYHRRRGLYCGTGDCPNCLMTVNGEPATRTCCTPAAESQRVDRGSGWPSADHDALSVLWHLRALLPVGFYYKSMIDPPWVFPIAERLIRKVAGIGPVPRDLPVTDRERLHHHPTVLVIGGGVAGLAAALAAAELGHRVLLVEEGTIGETIGPGALRDRLLALRASLERQESVMILERATAVGIYEGPLVPVIGEELLHLVHPQRIVVATGAVDRHVVFPGSDLPGVWLGRGAARMTGVHGLVLGRSIVVVASTEEGVEHLALLHRHAAEHPGSRVVAAVVPATLADRVPRGVEILADGEVVEGRGRRALRTVVIEAAGVRRAFPCDALVLSLGLEPRDGLLRQAVIEPVAGAGDVIRPGCTRVEAEASGRSAATEVRTVDGLPTVLPHARPPVPPAPPAREGFLCLCEDVGLQEVEHAWHEGYCSTELLKRYTTMTMGACQGALCQPHLRAFACARSPDARVGKPTTARPPARPVRLGDLAAGARVPIEYHTSLHDRHIARGAQMEWAGTWKRPSHYGNASEEYLAVRHHVSVMDVSTLGKYRVAGPQATELLERVYPCRVADLKPGRSRYALLLNEAGYLFDDGLICALGDGSYYLTFSSSGGDAAESWLREWADAFALRVHIANQTASRSAINVAGPRARELLARLTSDPIDAQTIPYGGLREIIVGGISCLAIRVGFVGELSFELHHASRQSVALWDALLDAGRTLDIRPHGLDTLKLLRLEKGHLLIGQDTDFDTTPAKVGLDWAVKMEKPDFIGRIALRRLATLSRERSLLAMTFEGPRAPDEGAQLFLDGMHAGYLTSSRFSPVLGRSVALGWLRHGEGAVPTRVTARDGAGDTVGTVTRGPFYDPKGERLRA